MVWSRRAVSDFSLYPSLFPTFGTIIIAGRHSQSGSLGCRLENGPGIVLRGGEASLSLTKPQPHRNICKPGQAAKIAKIAGGCCTTAGHAWLSVKHGPAHKPGARPQRQVPPSLLWPSSGRLAGAGLPYDRVLHPGLLRPVAAMYSVGICTCACTYTSQRHAETRSAQGTCLPILTHAKCLCSMASLCTVSFRHNLLGVPGLHLVG